jgi:hypothetical protein
MKGQDADFPTHIAWVKKRRGRRRGKEEISRRKWKNSARAESRENGKWPELLEPRD